MLEIKNITLRNFMSYGDYDTSIQLDDLGPCFIAGEISDSISEDTIDSNGAGKTSLLESIVWCLFGRTSRLANPGDQIINHYTGKNCYVKIDFKNGDSLTRTRKYAGHNELLYIKDGVDVSLGTTKMQNTNILKELDLDWDAFIGSTFFSQSGKSWMGMSDLKRKEAIEREFHLDRIKYYADAAKSRLDNSKAKQEEFLKDIKNIDNNIDNINNQIEEFKELSNNFESNKLEKQNEIKSKIKNLKELADKFEENKKLEIRNVKKEIKEIKESSDNFENNKQQRIDNINGKIEELKQASKKYKNEINDEIDNLNKKIELLNIKYKENNIDPKTYEDKWNIYNKLVNKLGEYKNKIDELNNKKRNIENDIKYNLDLINKWKDKSEKICEACEQVISEETINCKIADPNKKINKLNEELKNINNDIAKKEKFFNETSENIESKKPDISIDEVNGRIESNNDILEEINIIKESIDNIKSKDDPYLKLIDEHSDNINNIKNEKNYHLNDIKKLIKSIDNIKDRSNHHLDSINDCKKSLQNIKNEENNYLNLISKNQNKLDKFNNDKDIIQKDINNLDKLILHLNYIYRAYHDRRKIKSHLLSEYVPYLNDRISYYMNKFGLDLRIEFTNSLSIKNDMWGYNLFSGGESKRFDLSLMLAMFDLHTLMYGRSCNILVFDEVDTSLDESGVEILSNIIKDDFSGRVDSILIISHRSDMVGKFQSEIKVSRQDRFSKILSVIK